MELRPLVIARFGHSLGAIAFGAGASNLWVDGNALSSTAAVAGMSACFVTFVRSGFMKVVLEDDSVLIRGLLWSRRIPRAAITGVSNLPAVRWRDQAGRGHWSPILWMMTGGRTLEFINRHNREQLKRLRKWVNRKR